jgi:hypothetical protein
LRIFRDLNIFRDAQRNCATIPPCILFCARAQNSIEQEVTAKTEIPPLSLSSAVSIQIGSDGPGTRHELSGGWPASLSPLPPVLSIPDPCRLSPN